MTNEAFHPCRFITVHNSNPCSISTPIRMAHPQNDFSMFLDSRLISRSTNDGRMMKKATRAKSKERSNTHRLASCCGNVSRNDDAWKGCYVSCKYNACTRTARGVQSPITKKGKETKGEGMVKSLFGKIGLLNIIRSPLLDIIMSSILGFTIAKRARVVKLVSLLEMNCS